MKDKRQLLFPGVDAARSWTRTHPGQTRERGRVYPRNRMCPVCFQLFTSKGIGGHVIACRRRDTLTKALFGP